MRKFAAVFALAVAVSMPQSAWAETLTVPWEEMKVLRLPVDAYNVVIGNPSVVDVTVETPRMLFLFGRKPGETNITIFGENQEPVLAQTVAVVPASKHRVSVHSTAKGGIGGNETSYSCVGRCVRVPPPDGTKSSDMPAASDSAVPPAQ